LSAGGDWLAIGPDGMLHFWLGSATNCGVLGREIASA
jgi:hypothetical protein